MFITASHIVDICEKFEIRFDDENKNVLLEADTCFNRVLLPTKHESYEEFRRACIASVTLGAEGFGKF